MNRDTITCKPFPIPREWPRAYGMDVGWNWTAVAWFALDPNTNVFYCYTEHKRGLEKPIVHAQAIKARGEWLPGFIDPAASGRGQDDGERLLDEYVQLGLKLTAASNDRESGIIKIWQKLEFGGLKIFESCSMWLAEFDHYRRDENGKVVKKNDHLMDATRYFFNSGTGAMKRQPVGIILDHGIGGADAVDETGY